MPTPSLSLFSPCRQTPRLGSSFSARVVGTDPLLHIQIQQARPQRGNRSGLCSALCIQFHLLCLSQRAQVSRAHWQACLSLNPHAGGVPAGGFRTEKAQPCRNLHSRTARGSSKRPSSPGQASLCLWRFAIVLSSSRARLSAPISRSFSSLTRSLLLHLPDVAL